MTSGGLAPSAKVGYWIGEQTPSLHWTDVVPSVTVIVPDAASVETVALSALPPLEVK